MRTLYIECNMGAAGDMLMGALYELLEDKERFLKTMNSLGLPGVHVEAEAGKTCGIAGTHMRVTVHGEEETACGHDHAHDHHHHHHHATPGHIGELIDTLHLPEEVKKEQGSRLPCGGRAFPRGGSPGRGGRCDRRMLLPVSSKA